MTEITDRMQYVPGATQRIIKKTAETLYIGSTALAEGVGINSEKARRMANGVDVSRLYSFPASVAGQLLTHSTHSPSLQETRFFLLACLLVCL